MYQDWLINPYIGVSKLLHEWYNHTPAMIMLIFYDTVWLRLLHHARRSVKKWATWYL